MCDIKNEWWFIRKIDRDIHVKKEPHICAFGATHVRGFW